MRGAAAWLLLLVWTLPAGRNPPQPAAPPPNVQRIADGVELHRLHDPSLLSPAGPVAVQALRLDPRRVSLEIAIANDRLPARETVADMAARKKGIAAVNAGFFAVDTGAPAGLLKVRGRLLGGNARARGAVAFLDRQGRTLLLFDRVSADRGRGSYAPSLGSAVRDWQTAKDAVGGAGLLMLNGREFDEWTEERIAAGFDTTRHPRTMIGEDGTSIWLVTVDGRQPWLSLGMSFTELRGLARRLGLRSALNLDGGGSTTMVVRGVIVNNPSDATGPRPVSDAIVVRTRR
ncbi:MAG TPA: phosphodiester glycosidase family protein [Vicinamibacterales bacterium]|nr:phosphodiester glycosidase family protein [Vicinamibacterales bacterium]